MCENTRLLLAAALTEEEDTESADRLRRMGLAPTQQNAILLQLVQQAKRGDIRSIQLIRDLSAAEEKPQGSRTAEELRQLTVEELEEMLKI